MQSNDADAAMSSFDEETYMRHNPDVARAVAAGQFSSGLEHFIKFGQREKRRGAPLLEQPTLDGVPMPPEHLRLRVHGAREREGYVRVGQTVAGDLAGLLLSGQVRIPDGGRVLDFGCGPGRVITWFQKRYPHLEYFGTDIDAEAIGWAKSNLAGIATFDVNESAPPLRYSDEFFDFVFSISIFTHLPEAMQSAWLAELARVTKPGGYLVLTTHSEKLLTNARSMPASGFFYSVGPGTDGLPAFYQTSFQTAAYIQREWSAYFNVENILPRGLAGHQDLVICRR